MPASHSAATPPKAGLNLAWRLFIALAATATLSFALAGVAVYRVFSLSDELVALRDSITSTYGLELDTEFHANAGTGLLTLARVALTFAPDEAGVPAYVGQALAATRRISLGFYRTNAHPGNGGTDASALSALEANTTSRGWESVVRVSDATDSVLILVRGDPDRDHQVEVCLGVLSGREMVLIHSLLDADRLVRLAESVLREEGVLASAPPAPPVRAATPTGPV